MRYAMPSSCCQATSSKASTQLSYLSRIALASLGACIIFDIIDYFAHGLDCAFVFVLERVKSQWSLVIKAFGYNRLFLLCRVV